MNLLTALLLFFSIAAQGQDSSWYKMLSGSIGKFSVVMHLHRAGHVYYGYYYYNSTQRPLMFQGADTIEKGTIHLSVSSSGAAADEDFRFVLQEGAAAGTWKAGKKSLPFVARQSMQEGGFEFYYFNKAEAVKPNMDASPLTSIETAVVWPSQSAGAGNGLRKEVLGLVGAKPGAGNLEAALIHAADAYLNEARKDAGAATEETIRQMPSVYTRNQTARALIAYRGKALLSVAFFSYAYTGGAHGNYGTLFTAYNTVSGKKLRLNDVLTAAGIKQLPRLLAAAFRQEKGLRKSAPLTDGGLFDNKLKPTNNFSVSGRGIGFHYVPYEVGPYAMGELNIWLPYEQVKPYLQPAFVNVLKKN